jgi:hypothetical protein
MRTKISRILTLVLFYDSPVERTKEGSSRDYGYSGRSPQFSSP